MPSCVCGATFATSSELFKHQPKCQAPTPPPVASNAPPPPGVKAAAMKEANERRAAEAQAEAVKNYEERQEKERQELQELAQKSLTLEAKCDVWVLDEDGRLFCNGVRYYRPEIGAITAFNIVPHK